MKLRDNVAINDHYDVVVIGAGIGGLTAGSLLAKKGLKVLVLEQHYIPGGCCSAIRRNGVTMDVGAAMLFGFGETGYSPHRWVMNEIEEEIDMIPHDSLYRLHVSKKKTLTFWHDMNRFLDEIGGLFPHQDKEVRALYDEFMEFFKGMVLTNSGVPVPPTEVDQKEGLKLLLKHPKAMLKTMKFLISSEEDILKKYISDPKLMAIFDFLTGTYTCCNTTESPALLGATMFIDNHVGGACYPAGSPQMLPNKLEKSIESNGGQVVYREVVEEILIWQGKAYGVRLVDGMEIKADAIVANVPIWNLYGKMINRRHIKPRRMKWAQNMEPTYGTVVLYIAVKGEAVPEKAKHIEMYAENIHDFSGPNYTVFIPSVDDPSICPDGTHSLTVIVPTKLKWPRPDDPFYQSEEYNKLKDQEAEKVIAKMEKRDFPNIRENILSMEVATPTTLERFTMRPYGNVGGPKLTNKQHFYNRLKARSEWKNLYCTGDSTSMGEGVVASTVSGIGAAVRVLEDLGRAPMVPRKYAKQYVNLVPGRPWASAPDPSEPITEAAAQSIAQECQYCENPACRDACPANIETCLFTRRIEAGNFLGAARALREVNPLSAICGQICPAERFCEKECNRLDFDDKPVRIRDLHGWVCGHVPLQESTPGFLSMKHSHKVAVVGAGPAGLTCAHYLARLGYQVDVMDKAKKAGGMLTHIIPAFRLPDEVVNKEIEEISLSRTNFQFGKSLGKDYTVESLEQEYDAVFLSPGLWKGRMLDLPGMDKVEVTDALTLLKTYRAKGKVNTGNEVLIIGGGSVASDAAMVVKETGAMKVTMVCLEGPDEMPCLASELRELKHKGIEIKNGFGPKAFASATSISCVACTAVVDDKGRFNPCFDENQTMTVNFDQVVMAVGQIPEPSLEKYLEKALGQKGLIAVDSETMQIKDKPGLYAGGDIVRGAGTVVEAVGDGRRAAWAIDNYVREE